VRHARGYLRSHFIHGSKNRKLVCENSPPAWAAMARAERRRGAALADTALPRMDCLADTRAATAVEATARDMVRMGVGAHGAIHSRKGADACRDLRTEGIKWKAISGSC
jgi:hypothetical protein